MNRGITIFFITFLSIIVFALIVGFIFLLNGDFNFSIFSGNNYSNKLVESKEFDTTEDINIKGVVCGIFFEESTNGKISVELYSEGIDDYSITNDDNKLSVDMNNKKKTFTFFSKADKLVIKLPKEYDKNAKIDLETGDVHIGNYENMNFDIKDITGDIKADKVNDMTVDTTTGDVKIESAHDVYCKIITGDVRINTVNILDVSSKTGDIKVENINYRLSVDNKTGDIVINNAHIKEDSSITVTTGDVKISYLQGAYVESSTRTGDNRINNNDRNAPYTLKISATTGDIKVNQ